MPKKMIKNIENSKIEFDGAEKSKIKKREKNQDSSRTKRRYHWKYTETRNYCNFIKKNEATLMKQFKRQKQKVYNKMAECIRTRSSRQCKSHHQKMMKKYHSIKNILEKLVGDSESFNEIPDDDNIINDDLCDNKQTQYEEEIKTKIRKQEGAMKEKTKSVRKTSMASSQSQLSWSFSETTPESQITDLDQDFSFIDSQKEIDQFQDVGIFYI